MIADRYEALGGMRAGGMSEAHEYRDVRLNRRVILKTLKKGEAARRLEDEQKSLLKLRSNHVVQLLDIVSIEHAGEEIPCLVLEYIDGTDLAEGQFQIDHQYLAILWQIAKGIEAIHSAGLVHRDLKPDNVRLDKEGVIKIIDFGLSREIGIDNRTHAAIGYLPYMAPELLTKGEKEFSTATDMFAFGVLALAITANGLPEWCRRRVPPEGYAVICANHAPQLDAGIAAILQNCLSSAADHRPSASDAVKAIEKVLLRDRHRARIVIAGKVSELSSSNRVATPTLKSGNETVCQVRIEYSGSEFVVTQIVGEAWANNFRIAPGMSLPNSCVITMKTPQGRAYYSTFDISNPEFMV